MVRPTTTAPAAARAPSRAYGYTPGQGALVVNGKPAEELFTRERHRKLLDKPFTVTGTHGKFSAQIKCTGGGVSGWAGAIQHGIARALISAGPTYRPALKRAGLLTA